ncbi:MAG: class II fructose-bisphosphate aldolase [Kiritimatiellaeota bacterium]|nr:class II fructose-bisphosphate aldolase [Kiritimatiellota bacterium]
MAELLVAARAGGYAVPSFCAWNAEVMEIVLRVAQDLRSPVIVMNGPGEFSLLVPALMGAVAHTVARGFTVPAALHLDHGDSMEMVQACLEAGYTSVMLDYSNRPFAENAGALRQVVTLAHALGVTVEGELGHVGKVDTVTVEGTGDSTLTEPGEAAAYVEQTGVDALAVSIGNAHGQYTKLPKFDFARLEKIRAAVRLPLVLHGGSGTPPADIQRAIALGMAKVNVATEIVATWRETLYGQWGAKQNLWAPQAMAEAKKALVPVVQKWIRLTGAEGRA